ncbi:MAG: LysM peptidoglycan-binding domain-containing protein, partial [Methylococcales bacterium]
YTGHGSKSGLKKAASKRKSNRVASKSRKAASKAVANYTVKKGDSLTKLARRYNVSVTDLRKWNGRKKGKTLLAGQRLKIRK